MNLSVTGEEFINGNTEGEDASVAKNNEISSFCYEKFFLNFTFCMLLLVNHSLGAIGRCWLRME